MTEQELENLQVEDLGKLTLNDLRDQAVLGQIEKLASDPMYDYEPALAEEFYESLSSLIQKFAGQINGTSGFTALNKILVRLGWQSLQILGKKFRRQILSDNIVESIKNGINIIFYLDRYLSIFEAGLGPDQAERQTFIFALIRNQERVGAQAISLKSGENKPPTIANWISDYVSYTDPNSLRGESYDLTQYFFASPNVKNLPAQDRALLRTIMSIYNYLKSPRSASIVEPLGTSENLQIPKIPAVPQNQIPAIPRKPNPPPQQAPPPPTAPKSMSDFDKKLASVAAPSTHGRDLEVMRKQMQQKVSFVRPPPAPVSGVKMTPTEIKREVRTQELPAHQQQAKPAFKPTPTPPAPKPVAPPIRPVDQTPYSASTLEKVGMQSLNQISVIDDLKKAGLPVLREGPIDVQAAALKSKILNLAKANKVLPYYAVYAFEQSPLFQAYLQIGSAIIADNNSDRKIAFKNAALKLGSQLTFQEFEAIADLKKEIEKM